MTSISNRVTMAPSLGSAINSKWQVVGRMSRTAAAMGAALLIVTGLTISSAEAGFTNNSGNPSFVVSLGPGTGSFRVNSLTENGEMKTSANSAIDPAVADSYSEEFSGSFDSYWVSTANWVCGIDFDVVFDAPIVGIVATNGFGFGGVGPLGIDLMREFTFETWIPSFLGQSPRGLEILPYGESPPDSLTVDGNRVTGSVNSIFENFVVLTSASGAGYGSGSGGGSGVVGTPEPAAMTVWALLGLVALGAGYMRLRRNIAC